MPTSSTPAFDDKRGILSRLERHVLDLGCGNRKRRPDFGGRGLLDNSSHLLGHIEVEYRLVTLPAGSWGAGASRASRRASR